MVDKEKLVMATKLLAWDQLKACRDKAFLFKPADGDDKPGFQTRVGSDGKGRKATDDQLANIFGNVRLEGQSKGEMYAWKNSGYNYVRVSDQLEQKYAES